MDKKKPLLVCLHQRGQSHVAKPQYERGVTSVYASSGDYHRTTPADGRRVQDDQDLLAMEIEQTVGIRAWRLEILCVLLSVHGKGLRRLWEG